MIGKPLDETQDVTSAACRGFVRVSSEVNSHGGAMGQIMDDLNRNEVAWSRTSNGEPRLPPNGAFKRKFSDKKLPVVPAYNGPEIERAPIFKHGCTNDLREMWRKVTDAHAFNVVSEGTDAVDRNDPRRKLNDSLLQLNLATSEWLKKGGANPVRKKFKQRKKRRGGRVSTSTTNAHLS